MDQDWEVPHSLGIYIRSNLERSYQRLHAMHAQGRNFSDTDFLLNMFRDMHVVPLQIPSEMRGQPQLRLKIPLIYAEDWILETDQKFEHHWKQKEKKFATMFEPQPGPQTQREQQEQSIHQLLVASLNDFFNEYHRSMLLLDVVKRPSHPTKRFEWGGPGFMHSENRGAFYQGTPDEPHLLIKNFRDKLPKLLLEIQALIRVTFPLDDTATEPPFKMGTIVIGFGGLSRKLLQKGEVPEELMNQLLLMIRILYNEIPRKYGEFWKAREGNRPSRLITSREPSELHRAVDLLHLEIAALAERRGLPNWKLPPGTNAKEGYNFLIAFRELDPFLMGHLRYYLTDLNYEALRSSLSKPANWPWKDLTKLRELMTDLFSRTLSPIEAITMADEYVKKCEEELREVVEVSKDHNEIAKEFYKRIQESTYPLYLTPGYHVMTLGYPEIVKDWLADPRARSFEKYPPLLLAWEHSAVSGEMYYSPIAEGNIRFGICGVHASLLDRGGGSELQRLIDNGAIRFRNIICNNLVRDLKQDLSAARLAGTSGFALWEKALQHFRQLAYYYLTDTDDYFTKLANDQALTTIDGELAKANVDWQLGETERWKYTKNISDKIVSALRQIKSTLIRDYLEEFLTKQPKRYDLSNACLFRINLQSEPEISLLVLVPSPHNFQHATELIHRFTSACDSALNTNQQELEGKQREIGHEFVYLLPMLRACLSGSNGELTSETTLLIEVLENEVAYFNEKYSDITSGSPISVKQLFALLCEIRLAINQAMMATGVKLGGDLASVKDRNIQILKKGLDEITGSQEYLKFTEDRLGISNSAASLLLWEISVNLCKHARSRVRFSLSDDEDGLLTISIESDRDRASPVDQKGRHGLDHINNVAKVIGVRFSSGLDPDDSGIFRSTLTFNKGVQPQ